MSRSFDRTAALLAGWLAMALPAHAQTGEFKPRFGFGKPATAAEIKGWDIDVRPDGKGLPDGRGTVAQGQVIYDEKCASCHGTFGESNDYMILAGGVGTLATDQPIRTTGSKLNHATTLWDYINRAMPFANPKSLSPDEVYALTAYVLHLSDLLPADAALDQQSIGALKLPNRDGFTIGHGLMRKDGKPDTRNVACISDCAATVRLSSEMPEHARDSHGNLADQVRTLGPGDGVQAVVAKAGSGGAELARQSACMACHGVGNRIVGPALREIAAKYAGDALAESRLTTKVKQGGAGVWGQIPMPAQPQLKEADARAIVQWILAGAR